MCVGVQVVEVKQVQKEQVIINNCLILTVQDSVMVGYKFVYATLGPNTKFNLI